MIPRQYRIHAVLLLSALLIIFLPRFSERPEKEKAQAAAAAVDAFLQRVDSDRYAESWQISASLLKGKVPEQLWVDQLGKIRAVAGPLVERTEESMTYSTSAKDSPEGEYIVVTFDTSFERKKDASEIVTVTLDTDGVWRVAGYFIR
ncbi:hypothetical protein DSOUD_1084 [Desulfuromonas soudanensis]|uniref:DUF4019 domain-containing protein n=1 Tax=Desulfuromonas soudanensis TaxID=1603606 RepID=A0A0M5IYS3_9BACT|nr:DUF4019 domain-containing protein [Desulfuromonas soudanensis]ALC15868.1 hypothetical protein DSOUD_1084 [Desulfuromonas soudanensis]